VTTTLPLLEKQLYFLRKIIKVTLEMCLFIGNAHFSDGLPKNGDF
jgi:hypothetical protein